MLKLCETFSQQKFSDFLSDTEIVLQITCVTISFIDRPNDSEAVNMISTRNINHSIAWERIASFRRFASMVFAPHRSRHRASIASEITGRDCSDNHISRGNGLNQQVNIAKLFLNSISRTFYQQDNWIPIKLKPQNEMREKMCLERVHKFIMSISLQLERQMFHNNN